MFISVMIQTHTNKKVLIIINIKKRILKCFVNNLFCTAFK